MARYEISNEVRPLDRLITGFASSCGYEIQTVFNDLLKEETEERKLSQRRLAEQMGISYKVLNDILNCRRPITTQTAMLFEAALGISASLLMRMQLDCNMQQAAADPSFMERLKQVRKYAAML